MARTGKFVIASGATGQGNGEMVELNLALQSSFNRAVELVRSGKAKTYDQRPLNLDTFADNLGFSGRNGIKAMFTAFNTGRVPTNKRMQIENALGSFFHVQEQLGVIV